MKYIDFSEQIKSVRKTAGVTQQALADALGVHLQTVSKWERGVSQPDVSLLGDIAKICNVTLEKLLGVPSDRGEVYQGIFDVAQLCAKITELRRKRRQTSSLFKGNLGFGGAEPRLPGVSLRCRGGNRCRANDDVRSDGKRRGVHRRFGQYV